MKNPQQSASSVLLGALFSKVEAGIVMGTALLEEEL